MKIKYQFVNETTEIEVSDDWGAILIDLDKHEFNNNRKETRRHLPIDTLIFEGEKYGAEDDNLLSINGRNEMEILIHEAIDSLTPDQKDLIQKIYFEDWSVIEYAEMLGVMPSAVSHRLIRARKKLKKFLTDRQF
ncbi:MAG: RNA polymerase sigma factor [Firmicutes bacterium]|jgi:RNA polymerase sigma factor (sigma-70 family)|nr:RNA polymerase sigma factor [Bacillota bacterium]